MRADLDRWGTFEQIANVKYTYPHEAYKAFKRIEVDHLDTNNASAPCSDQVAIFVFDIFRPA